MEKRIIDTLKNYMDEKIDILDKKIDAKFNESEASIIQLTSRIKNIEDFNDIESSTIEDEIEENIVKYLEEKYNNIEYDIKK